MIRYTCPSCKTLLESPDHKVGTEVACPTCDERLRVPLPATNHAIVASCARQDDYPVLDAVDDEDEVVRKPIRSRRRRRRFECYRCGSTYPPVTKTEISQTGWILFVVLLVMFWPLCFIGLFQKESFQACADCGARVGKRRAESIAL
jgi:DNA-directed RNA polymerase subunit RPC12/RpoP